MKSDEANDCEVCVKADFDCLHLGRLAVNKKNGNVNYHICRTLYLIHPYTDEMRKRTRSIRGREGFSYGKAVCVLPSARFYGHRQRVVDDNFEEVDENNLETERDEED